MSSTQEIYVRGLSDLRDGALLLIVASVVSIAAGVILYVNLHDIETYFSSLYLDEPERAQGLITHMEEFIAVILVALVAILFASIIQLIAIFGKIVPGASKLARVDPDYSTSSTMIKIGYVVGLILGVVGFVVLVLAAVAGVSSMNIATLVLGVLGGLALLVIALIFLVIGEIGFILLSFKLGEKEIQSEYTIVAVLLIIWFVLRFVSIVVTPIGTLSEVIHLIALILLYYALSKTIGKRKTMPPTPLANQQLIPPPL